MIDQLREDIRRIVRRGSSVFVRAASTGDFRNIGEATEVSTKIAPINAPKSTAGDVVMTGVSIEVGFKGLQNGDADLLGLSTLALNEADILITRKGERTQTLTTAQALAAASNGVLICAVPVQLDFEIGETPSLGIKATAEFSAPYAELL